MEAIKYLKETGWEDNFINDDEKGPCSILLSVLMDNYKKDELIKFMNWYYSNVHLENYNPEELVEMYMNDEIE